MGLQTTADGKDSPLQFGRNVLGDMVVGSGQVVETFGAGLEIAAPPLVKPSLDAAHGRADVLDGPAGKAQIDGTLTCREFVVHGVLRSAAAGGCPRRTL